MLKIPATVRVFIALEPCDMRRQLDGLSALVRSAMARDPDSGDLYVFYNRRADMLKALFVDGHGPCMLVKRVSKGRFIIRAPVGHTGHVEMESAELATLLSELRFDRECPKTT